MTTLVTDERRPRRWPGWPRTGRPMAATRETAILGIDLGTTEVKVGLVTLDGRLLGLARTGYRTDADPATGRARSRIPRRGGVRSRPRSGELRRRRREVSRSRSTAMARRSSPSTPRPVDAFRDHLAGLRGRPRGSRAGRRDGPVGWSLAGLPAALWVERNEPAVAAATCWYLATWDCLAPAAHRSGDD